MKKESKIILSIIVIILVATISYFVGYKKAYDDYEAKEKKSNDQKRRSRNYEHGRK